MGFVELFFGVIEEMGTDDNLPADIVEVVNTSVVGLFLLVCDVMTVKGPNVV